MTKIVYVGLLGGWFVVRGAHHTPISGRFESKAEAEAWLHARRGALSDRAMLLHEYAKRVLKHEGGK